jgi:S1-C subfamily serine protease
MWKFLSTSACLSLLSCHAATAAPVMTLSDEPTLAILGPDGVTCGAVAVTTELAITANHCVPDAAVSFVTANRKGEADRTSLGIVIGRAIASDLAVFSGDGFVPATLAQGTIDYEHATTIVTHVPVPWSVQKLHPTDAREGYVQTERLDLGMSGSGLWDDGGHLVGIAVGNDAKAGYFAGSSRILKLLDASPVKAELRRPAPTAALWGDTELTVDGLVAAAQVRRLHIEAALQHLERPRD